MKKISQFNVMGSFEVKDENGETIEFSHRKVQALLAYLSLERSRPRSRERLATLLWSRTGDERARHNLRQALSRIRKQCPDLIDSRDDTVALKATACTVDVICFSDLVQSDEISDLQQALELYRGDLLADYSVSEPEFQDWLQQARGRIRRQTCEVADRLAARLREQGRDREAVDVLNRLLWIDPANESAHRDLMLLFTGMGRRSEALLQYQECAAALSRELDVEPGPETRQLLGEIKNEKLTTSAGENKSTRPLPGNLATILYADVARHSHLVDENEDETHRTLCHYLDLINTHVNECDGRVMYSAGDAVLAQFTDAVDALSCALMVQHELDDLNQSLDESRQVCFRIGVNSGDVIEDHDDVYGEGVDVAIRLEALAQLGGVCVSDTVRQGVSSRISADFQFIGEQQVKNIAEPIRAYYVAEPGTRVNQTEKPAQVNVLTPLVVPGKPSLVVKPFVNLSTEAEQDFFAEGLTREICTALVKIPSLFLAWDESPAAHISRDMSVSELGRRFGVRFVLSGGIRRQGDRVRVNAELVEAQSGQCVWADRFDRELKDLFLVQDEITEEIVTAMDVKLVHGEAARFMRKAVTSPAALEAMYQGWHALYQGTSRQDIREAQHLFEEVIRLEPEAGFAYASASLAYWAEAGFGRVIVDSPLLDRSTELARRALEYGDTTGFPEMVLALDHLGKQEYDQAVQLATEGVIARPSCNGAYAIKSCILNYLGRSQEAIELARYAVRLSPVYPAEFPAILATAYHDSGHYDEAVTAALASLQLREDDVDPLLILAASYVAQGKYDEASDAVAKVRKIEPDFRLDEYAATQPYRNPRDLECLLERLDKAGLGD